MKQLLVLSGKGGTGKTTIASALIKISEAKAFADCDIDAPNLHLVLKQRNEPIRKDYFGLPKAEINQDICRKCGLCLRKCRFDSINLIN
ncbi:MAG: ATPase, partial [Eubacteriales bacterium]|nr:ATPase [Eubacteriales bacterium]